MTDKQILKTAAGCPPSLMVHLYATHFRFDGQESKFSYQSPMKLFIDHLRKCTVPHDLLEYFNKFNVAFYEGCLIVVVQDHRTPAQAKEATKPSSTPDTTAASIHNYNQWMTPSPYAPFPRDSGASPETANKAEDARPNSSGDNEAAPAPATPKGIATPSTQSPRTFTRVLRPTPESLSMDLYLRSQKGATESRGALDTPGLAAPQTPLTMVPPTPTAGSMPPPAKRQKKEKTELDLSDISSAEGQVLLATEAPL